VKGGEPPESLRWHWEAFWEISVGRQAGFAGPAPLTWQDIQAWARLMRIRLLPDSVRIIKAMDAVFMDWAAKQAERR